MSLPAPSDFQWARQRRRAGKAAGGVLDPVLPLRVGGTAQPLFCAHPLVGLSWCYTGLFQHIGAEHPVYGLQSRGLRRPEPLPTTMAEMARDFADQIRMVQPTGPYHLLGWSLGAIVALAVTEELERRGHEVALLAALDAYPNDPLLPDPDKLWLLANFVLAEFGYNPVLAEGDQELDVRILAAVRGRPGLALDDWTDERVVALLRVLRNNVTVGRAYQPERVRSGLLFVAATQSPPELSRKLDGWRPFIEGPIDVVEIDCRHQHLMLPGPAAAVGAVLTSRMAAGRMALQS